MSNDSLRFQPPGTPARDVRARFAAGVCVVTTQLGPRMHGTTVTSVCRASDNPPRLVIALERHTRSVDLVAEVGLFAVNVLAWQQMFLADRFAGRAPLVDPRFSGVAYRAGQTGVPLIADALAWIECRVVLSHPAGDHVLFLGDAVHATAADGDDALVYFDRRYHCLGG